MASKKPSGLGRGLGALLGDDVMKTESSGSLSLPISQVETCSSQPRKRFDDESLQELADSISAARHHSAVNRAEAVIRLLSDHCRRTPLAGSPAGGLTGGAGHRHRGR